jgi:hypothetical protein
LPADSSRVSRGLVYPTAPRHCDSIVPAFQFAAAIPSSDSPTDPSKDSANRRKKTQVALVKSDGVLTRALRDPTISALPIVLRQADPLAWLQQELKDESPQDGELLSISLRGAAADREELRQVVDAVAKSYREEVIAQQQQERMNTRDLLARNLADLNEEIKRGSNEYMEVARESRKIQPDSEPQRLNSQQLVNEIRQIEKAIANEANGGTHEPDAKVITQLRDRQTKLMESLKRRLTGGPDLGAWAEKLRNLQRTANDMAVRLENLERDASQPDRIQQIQHATVVQEY